MIRLDIISDIACPWCYVGKAYLDRALEAHPDHPFTVEWHPFQLNPEMPKAGMDRRDYMEAKFGGKDGEVRAYAPLVEHAAAAGVELNLDRIARQANTLDAHRLIHWAGLEGRQTPMVAALFRALWRDGRDVGDPEVLAEIAGEVGLDRAMVRRLLDGDADAEDIRARDAHARARGVSGVPTFIIDNRYAVQGAQPTSNWLRIIDEAIQATKEPPNV
ncbi:MAG: polyketide biosynthesis protein [Rhodobacterales bacterium 32-67-9]|nr:MAG: polyketide biosynthesis protein [Rhodobacterales bacterium 32-67-9]